MYLSLPLVMLHPHFNYLGWKDCLMQLNAYIELSLFNSTTEVIIIY